jgi:Domain of unknown function (DUF6602)
MSKLEIGYLIRAALRHGLEQQAKLLQHEKVVELMPVIRQLTQFTLELEDWYSDKYHLKDRSDFFLAEAEKIEAEADRISEQLWRAARVSLTPIFRKIKKQREQLASDKSYSRHLRSQFNNFRLGLLEQVAGARLLENNSDLGEEIERILVQHFERRLGQSVRILRGGHIYDYEDNRSDQVDIIVTPADALSSCPADTDGGKYNVMIDQVIAAVSVTSRLTATKLRECWQSIQRVPLFQSKEQSYPNLQGHAWPLCYIIGAESDELESLARVWQELGAATDTRHVPQMMLLLDSGYIIPGTACWPKPKWSRGTAIDLHIGTGLQAGLGLAWLEAQIAGRNSVISGRSLGWLERLAERLSKLELREAVPPTYDPRYDNFLRSSAPIHGILTWGWEGMHPHNQLGLTSIRIGSAPEHRNATLLNRSQPLSEAISKQRYFGRYDFEPRWFRMGLVCIHGDYCALEEWTDPNDRQNHKRHIVVFDSRTGEDVTSKLTKVLEKCSDLDQLNPVLRVEAM